MTVLAAHSRSYLRSCSTSNHPSPSPPPPGCRRRSGIQSLTPELRTRKRPAKSPRDAQTSAGQDYPMFRKLLIFSLTLPYGLSYLGAALNQLVIIANHGKFPVMLNPVWNTNLTPDSDGMIDAVHCVMSSSTHLNYLADIFNFHTHISSIGDLLLDAGNTLDPYCSGFFICLVLFLVIVRED